MERDSAVLRLDKICKSFGGLQVLAEVDLTLGQEEIVGLIGPNGAGKSTLFNVITSIYKPNRGEIYLQGQKITGFAPHRICRMGIARTFQLIQQAVSDLNKKGGIFVKEFGKKLPVKLIAADDESDPGKGVAAMEKLIRVDKVDLFLSGHSTPLTVPQNITADKYKIYYHGTMCVLPIWRERKFQWSTIFTFDLDQATDLPYQLWDSLPPSEKIQRPALLMEDSLDGRGFADFFRPHAAKHNYKFVVDEPWAIGAKDYSSQILKFKANNADAVLIFGSNTDCITLVRQLKENAVSVKYLHGWKGTWGSEFWAALGKDAQYVLTDGHWSEYFSYPGAKELGERYTKKFNKQSVSVGMYYALCQILWKAIENAGTLDSAKVKQAVVNHEFKGTVMGDVKYLEDGSAVYLSTANQWWDGKQRLVFPVIKGGWKFKLAPPWEKR